MSVDVLTLDRFAPEILFKIFAYLPTNDLLTLSQTCRHFSQVIYDKHLWKTIDLRSCRGIKWKMLQKFLRRNGRNLVIERVHLDYCYWLDWSQDTRFFKFCPDLTALTMHCVPLALSQLVSIFQFCKQINYLAFSFNGHTNEQQLQSNIMSLNDSGAFRTIQRLDLTLDTDSFLPPRYFWDTFDNLEELNLIFTDSYHYHFYYEDTLFSFKPRGIADNRLPKLKRFVTTDMTGKLHVPMYSSSERKQFADVVFNRNLDRAFLQLWNERRHKSSISDNNGNLEEGPSCAILNRVPKEMHPWPGLRHLAICLHGSYTSLSSMLCTCTGLSSLVLLITHDTEQTSLIQAVSKSLPQLKQFCIMKRSGVPWMVSLHELALPALTHLSLPAAAVQSDATDIAVNTCETSSFDAFRNGFKRSRVGVSEAVTEHFPLNEALLRSSRLSSLELGLLDHDYDSCVSDGSPVLLHGVSQLKHLTQLSLHGLPLMCGKGLLAIAVNCQKLQFLSLKNLGPSGLCVYYKHLVQALPLMKSLLDLRVEQNSLVPCPELLQGLTQHCTRLQRLVIISPTPAYTSFPVDLVLNFIKGVTTLTFALFKSSYLKQKDEAAVARLVRKLRKSRPELVVLMSLDEEKTRDREALPLVHLVEMVATNSWARMHNAPRVFR